MSYVYPSVADFKAYFTRDFPYGTNEEEDVLDSDITKAFQQANVNINEALYASQADFTISYLYLAAHYLCVDFAASSQGINGKFTWLTTSKSVGSVSESYGIPQQILNNPYYSMMAKDNYGAKFLQMLYPRLAGQIFSVRGSTRP